MPPEPRFQDIRKVDEATNPEQTKHVTKKLNDTRLIPMYASESLNKLLMPLFFV
jgi:hypothetical protein